MELLAAIFAVAVAAFGLKAYFGRRSPTREVVDSIRKRRKVFRHTRLQARTRDAESNLAEKLAHEPTSAEVHDLLDRHDPLNKTD